MKPSACAAELESNAVPRHRRGAWARLPWGSALLVFAALACRAEPVRSPPERAAPAAWSESESVVAAAEPIEAWWRTLQDPALDALVDVALENAVEGCVRETYGALIATRQAEAASDPVVRRAMRKIAADETAHAALSWDVASFFAGAR